MAVSWQIALQEFDLSDHDKCIIANKDNQILIEKVKSLRTVTEQQAIELSCLDNSILGLNARLATVSQALHSARRLALATGADAKSERRQFDASGRELSRLSAQLSDAGAARQQLTACQRSVANLELQRCRALDQLNGDEANATETVVRAAEALLKELTLAVAKATETNSNAEAELERQLCLRTVLNARLWKRRERLRDLCEEAAAVKAETSGAQSELNSDRCQLRQLRRQTSAAACERLAARDREIELLTIRAEAGMSRLFDAHRNVNNLREHFEKLSAEKLRTQKFVRRQLARLNSASSEAKEWRQSVALMRRRLLALARSQEVAVRDLDAALSVATELQTQVDAERSKLTSLRSHRERLQQALTATSKNEAKPDEASAETAAASMLKRSEASLRRLEARLDNLLTRSRPRVASRLRDLLMQDAALQDRLAESRSVLEKSRQRLASLKKSAGQQAARIEQQDAELARLKSRIAMEAAAGDKTSSKDEDLKKVEMELSSELDELKRLSDWLNHRQLLQMRAAAADWRRDIERLRRAAVSLAADVEAERHAGELARRAVARTSRERRAASEARQRAGAETERLKRSLATARDATAAATAEVEYTEPQQQDDASLATEDTSVGGNRTSKRRRRLARAASARRTVEEELLRCEALLVRMRRLRRQVDAVDVAADLKSRFTLCAVESHDASGFNDQRELESVKDALSAELHQLQADLTEAVERREASRSCREAALASLDQTAAELAGLNALVEHRQANLAALSANVEQFRADCSNLLAPMRRADEAASRARRDINKTENNQLLLADADVRLLAEFNLRLADELVGLASTRSGDKECQNGRTSTKTFAKSAEQDVISLLKQAGVPTTRKATIRWPLLSARPRSRTLASSSAAASSRGGQFSSRRELSMTRVSVELLTKPL